MFLVLLALWLIFNGKITFEIIWLGVLICGAVYLLCWKFFGYSPKNELRFVKLGWLIIEYAGLLVAEIFKANLVVVRLVLLNKKVNPVLVTFKSDLKTNAAKVLLSHSITLTPGTITVELKDNVFIVHCLDESMADGINESGFVKLLRKMESKTIGEGM